MSDIASMDELDLQLLAHNPHWRNLLEAYLIAATMSPVAPPPAPKSAAPTTGEEPPETVQETGPRWAARISQFASLDAEALSKAHGQLIAYGWLHFQFDDALGELTYRVAPDGRKILKKLSELDAAAESQLSETRAA